MKKLREVDLVLEKHVKEEFFPLTRVYPGIIDIVREFKFHPDRKWRFDFCVKQVMCAIEIEGGIFSRTAGRHTRGRGYQNDLDKYNAATAMGWTVFRFSIEDILKGREIPILKQWLDLKLVSP